ncbi:hypothetical protein [Nonomuraea sp. SYSU D8015]|uniref:hypothetical protein n=1 Tax=Nonomuraea sp. SYSU D8015 TaxID=2593644 RepID=UPI001661294B|nr:hypothetical protein [Nonomuraea sp. SYSU D8015]
MSAWTAIREEDGALLVPLHADIDGLHADGAVRIRPGDPGYDDHLVTALDARDLAGDRARDEELIARWEARNPAIPTRRSA